MTQDFNHRIKWILLFFCLPLITGSCIMDDLSDCVTNVSLKLTYTLNAEYRDLFSDYVDFLRIYVYATDGGLVQSGEIKTSNLSEGHIFSLNLDPGEYYVVVWGNPDPENYTIEETEQMLSMRTSLITQTGGTFSGTPAHLFHGITRVSVTPGEDTEQTIELTKDTNRVRIILKNFDSTRSINGGTTSVRLTGSNGVYNYENLRTGNNSLEYIPTYSNTGTYEVASDFSFMRLFIGDDSRIVISRNGETILYESLVSRLLENASINTNEDLDRYDNYTLTYSMDDTGGFSFLSIQISEWNDIPGSGGDI